MLEQIKINIKKLVEKCEPLLEIRVLVMDVKCSGDREPQRSRLASSCRRHRDMHPGVCAQAHG